MQRSVTVLIRVCSSIVPVKPGNPQTSPFFQKVELKKTTLGEGRRSVSRGSTERDAGNDVTRNAERVMSRDDASEIFVGVGSEGLGRSGRNPGTLLAQGAKNFFVVTRSKRVIAEPRHVGLRGRSDCERERLLLG